MHLVKNQYIPLRLRCTRPVTAASRIFAHFSAKYGYIYIQYRIGFGIYYSRSSDSERPDERACVCVCTAPAVCYDRDIRTFFATKTRPRAHVPHNNPLSSLQHLPAQTRSGRTEEGYFDAGFTGRLRLPGLPLPPWLSAWLLPGRLARRGVVPVRRSGGVVDMLLPPGRQ